VGRTKSARSRALGASPCWDVTRGSASVRVAVIDGGVTAVPDLYTQLDQGFNAIDNFSTDTSDEGPLTGHGTQVASIIAATSNNSAAIAGIASGLRIVPVKACFPQSGILNCPEGPLGNAFQWVANQGDIDVVNASIGGDEDTGFSDILLQLDRDHVIMVVAAGNAGLTAGGVQSPARDPHAIAVGGATLYGTRHPESSYGPELDVAAPHLTRAVNRYGYVEEFKGTSGATADADGDAPHGC